MKTKIIIALIAIAGMLELTGCKPKQTTLSGQIFIVTQGAENVKLGAVEILLIDKTQATNFLHAKQPAIESEMASKQEELQKIKQGHVPDVLLTNPAYAKALSESDELQKLEERQQARVDQLLKNYSDTPEFDKAFSDAQAKAKSIIL
jgi:wobble nucleotide-excising tRNase